LQVKEKYTEKSMLKAVHNYFSGDYKYCLKNSFVFRHDWESDYFCVNREGYAFEVEVKISKKDFKNDFKKEKHKLFEDNSTVQKGRLTPNRFYYAVPKDLLTESDIPKYAGLIYVDNTHAYIVKRAPFLHKTKHDYRKILCDKFYYQLLAKRKELNIVEYEKESLENKIKNFWITSFMYEKQGWQILSIDYKNKKVTGESLPYYDKHNHYKLIKGEEVREFDFKDVKFK